MKEIVEPLLRDCSTPEVFLFDISCPQCGQTYSSRPVRFSKAGVSPATDGKRVVYGALYEMERQQARDAAAAEAAELFNRCPICGRVVCNRCFLICEDVDMCTACASRLEEQGSPVASPGGKR